MWNGTVMDKSADAMLKIARMRRCRAVQGVKAGSIRGACVNDEAMSASQILTGRPRLSHADRREIVRRLIELEEDAQILADGDRNAGANFQLLDALEDDARQGARG